MEDVVMNKPPSINFSIRNNNNKMKTPFFVTIGIFIASIVFANVASATPQALLDLEASIRSDLDAYDGTGTSTTIFTVAIESDNGYKFNHSVGNSSMARVFTGASAAKMVSATVLLDLVQSGILNLEDNPQKYLGTKWKYSGRLSNLEHVTLRNLLNFTSGITAEPTCLYLPFWYTFETCVDNVFGVNARSPTPGTVFDYNASNLQIAGWMAMYASSTSANQPVSWHEIYDNFRNKYEVLEHSSYKVPSIKNPQLAAGLVWTPSDYMAFMEKLFHGEVLGTTEDGVTNYLSEMIAVQTSDVDVFHNHIEKKYNLGHDWRYGYGLWIECKPYDETCTEPTRVSSGGAFGSYPFMDFEHHYFGVIARQGMLNTLYEGIEVFELVEEKLEQWAKLANSL
ncbi:MAG: hypothetical protein COA99_05395 [Moraxellaceae bacterium]|nr:MAG: hypothetical protein COA99_05395 [Moraxellaceae bacterium]